MNIEVKTEIERQLLDVENNVSPVVNVEAVNRLVKKLGGHRVFKHGDEVGAACYYIMLLNLLNNES